MTSDNNETTELPVWSHQLRVSGLNYKHPRRFEIKPDAAILAAIAKELDLSKLNKLRFTGEISATGNSDWQLEAKLGATVQQPCSVTLEPVQTRLDVPVQRRFIAETEEYEAGSEYEMPDDDSVELLGIFIDIGEIMVESLALYLPLYPRAKGVEVENTVFTEPGKAPMTDDDARPFAGLESLRDKLAGGDG